MKSPITIIITFIIIFLLFATMFYCNKSYRTSSGRMYRARDLRTAEIIDNLRDISIHLSYSINTEDGDILKERLQNTSFKELFEVDPNILGWNYDKGREIGIKIYDDDGVMYPEQEIISTLFHELAHSLTEDWGHHENWQAKDDYLQTFVPTYVPIMQNKISQLN